jgi:hypothetical protein
MSDIPSVCFIEDVARALRTSVRTVKRLRRYRAFPIPELPTIDRRPRWSGEAVRRYVDGQMGAPRLRRAG